MQSSEPTLEQILSFVQQYPEGVFHTIDLPYRLCSPAAQEPANRRIWRDEAGEAIGFGITQLPFSTLDWGVRPGNNWLHKEIVAWGVQRLEEIARQRSEGYGYLLDSRSDNDAVTLQNGFELDDWYIRNLAMELSEPPRQLPAPQGFRIRPLQGPSEVAAYVNLHRAAFDTRNMSIEWRARTLSHPLYQPQLDLVAEAQDGQLVAFCIGWINRFNGELVGQIEPLGVLPPFQRRGLGRAILSECLYRLYQAGARRVLVDAESYNDASQHLYESSGFAEVARTHKYFRRF